MRGRGFRRWSRSPAAWPCSAPSCPRLWRPGTRPSCSNQRSAGGPRPTSGAVSTRPFRVDALPGVGDRGRGAGPVRLPGRGGGFRRLLPRPAPCPAAADVPVPAVALVLGVGGDELRPQGIQLPGRRRPRGPRRPRLREEHAAGCAAGDEPCLRLARAAGREPIPAGLGPDSTPTRSQAPWTGQQLRSQTTPICSHPRPTEALASLNSMGWRVILAPRDLGPSFGATGRGSVAATARGKARWFGSSAGADGQ